MKRALLFVLTLLFVPMAAVAQVEIGVDAGLSLESVDDAADDITSISIPNGELRVGFAAGEMIIVESRLGLSYSSVGDFSLTQFGLVPGVNVLLGDRFYARGEGGLMYVKGDDGTESDSATQYLLGAAGGLRIPMTENVLFRAELGADRWFENQDDFMPASWEFRIAAGVSAVVN